MGWTNLGSARWKYTRGLHDLGDGIYAWLQPDGSWGWSNAGLVVDGERSLLVDTLFDLRLTQEMLEGMRRAEPRAAAQIDALVNTHANGDHFYGNQLVRGAEIIASRACAEEIADMPPSTLSQMGRALAGQDTPLGRFVRRAFGPFDFEGITVTPPTRTFDGELTLRVGGKEVRLIEVGPAHTRGDTIVWVPADRVVFTGDILFVEGTPIVWAGPVGNWIEACRRMLALDVEVVVPGHGPITDRRGIEAVGAYFEYVQREARQRYDAGMDSFAAARDIALGEFSDWGDPERLAVNVEVLYREFAGDTSTLDMTALVGRMAELARDR
jgi:glyoxylase-like metal-dependent hydrolase (beta-lactamase superfamily II)